MYGYRYSESAYVLRMYSTGILRGVCRVYAYPPTSTPTHAYTLSVSIRRTRAYGAHPSTTTCQVPPRTRGVRRRRSISLPAMLSETLPLTGPEDSYSVAWEPRLPMDNPLPTVPTHEAPALSPTCSSTRLFSERASKALRLYTLLAASGNRTDRRRAGGGAVAGTGGCCYGVLGIVGGWLGDTAGKGSRDVVEVSVAGRMFCFGWWWCRSCFTVVVRAGGATATGGEGGDVGLGGRREEGGEGREGGERRKGGKEFGEEKEKEKEKRGGKGKEEKELLGQGRGITGRGREHATNRTTRG